MRYDHRPVVIPHTSHINIILDYSAFGKGCSQDQGCCKVGSHSQERSTPCKAKLAIKVRMTELVHIRVNRSKDGLVYAAVY